MLIDLLQSSYFSVFLIVALGFMLGRIKIAGLSLDVSAVIFIALAFGHWGVSIPKELGNFGFCSFLLSVFRRGPVFFIHSGVKEKHLF
jgi:putative transport protein